MANKIPHSFSCLIGEHAELERLFDSHQRALLEQNVGAALAVLKAFDDELCEHIDYEENTLLPLFAEEGGETEGATLEMFQVEHRKLREQADRLTKKTQAIFASSDLMGSIIALMDDEALFKGLFHHHALREKNLLFPRLDERTTEKQRERLLGRQS
jgi:iron-sulfur cluster repair protein YtfE (RIC family)